VRDGACVWVKVDKKEFCVKNRGFFAPFDCPQSNPLHVNTEEFASFCQNLMYVAVLNHGSFSRRMKSTCLADNHDSSILLHGEAKRK
jgi:hypothetical protein